MRRLAPLVLIALIALVSTGCSDDDDTDEGAAPSGSIVTTTTVRVLAADEIDDATPYCATWKEIRASGGPRTQGLSEEERVARRKAYYGSLLPLVERLLTQATDDIRPEVQRALDNTRDAATTGSFDSFGTPESKQGTQLLAQYALENCAKG